MIVAKIAGAFILAVPLLILAWWFLRRQRPVFLMSVAMILVGTGYLIATGATEDIGRAVMGFARDASIKGGEPPVPAPATAPTK